jgi:hypothetical protein
MAGTRCTTRPRFCLRAACMMSFLERISWWSSSENIKFLFSHFFLFETMHRSAQARKKHEDAGGETVIEMEALLSNKAHASPMSKECEVLVLFDEDNSASADTRRSHSPDDEEHSAAVKKGHLQSGASVSEPPRVLLIGVLLLSLGCMVAVVLLLPPLEKVDEGDKFLWRPRSASEFELDKRVLVRYRDEHSWQLLVGFSVIYIILQTFCVPASGTSMNVLAGVNCFQ